MWENFTNDWATLLLDKVYIGTKKEFTDFLYKIILPKMYQRSIKKVSCISANILQKRVNLFCLKKKKILW